MEGRCPNTYHCSNGSQPYSDIKPSLLLIPAYASLVNSSLSALGAVFIVLAYCAFKDLRKGTAQTIITLLALADLGSAVAGIFGASLFIRYFNLESDEKSEEECYKFDTVCQIQGFLVMLAYQCSLFWTSILSIHFLLITIFHHSTWTDKLLPLYNIIAWIVPLASAMSLLVLDKIGYNHYVTWTCFLRSAKILDNDLYIVSIGVWWVPEALVTSLILFSYTLTLLYIRCKQTNLLQRIHNRMLTIILAYLILRIPDLLQLTSVIIHEQPCSTRQHQVLSFVTVTTEAIAYSSQGWINCVLYIFLSPEMRRRMFVLSFRKITNIYKRHRHTQHMRTSEVAPLLGNTQNTPSTLRRARENGDTHLSFPTEFPTIVQAATSCPESLSRIPEIQ